MAGLVGLSGCRSSNGGFAAGYGLGGAVTGCAGQGCGAVAGNGGPPAGNFGASGAAGPWTGAGVGGTGGIRWTGSPAGTTVTAGAPTSGAPPASCPMAMLVPASWPSAAVLPESPLEGALEFGQTHLIREHETRLAPHLVAERAMTVLFTPTLPLPSATPLHIAAFAGQQQLGALAMRPPERLPPALEQQLTRTALPNYSTTAWSADVPFAWVKEGVELRIGFEDSARHLRRFPLQGLGAPASITMRRGRVTVFGDHTLLAPAPPLDQVTQDLFAALPVADLTLTEYTPLVLATLLATDGVAPVRRVHSDQELRAADPRMDALYYQYLKHFVAFRLSLAATGHGLSDTTHNDGNESLYAVGTTFVQGAYRNAGGAAANLYDHSGSLAAGWLGWTCLYVDQPICERTVQHEFGHSFTLQHFDMGSAAAWGIAAEYPQDGRNLPAHPWGFDTVRGRFRTWYRTPYGEFNAATLTGKRDPMNTDGGISVGEASDAASCFSQYTGYSTMRIQRWHEERPTLGAYDGKPGVFRWDAQAHRYQRVAATGGGQEPAALAQRTMTILGMIGRDLADVYGPVYTREGTLFALPDPNDPALPSEYQGARHFLEFETSSGTSQAMVAVGDLAPHELRYFSVNLPADGSVRRISLQRSASGYPNVATTGSTTLATLQLGPVPHGLPPVHRAGRAPTRSFKLSLTERCRQQDCARDRREAVVHQGTGVLSFDHAGRVALARVHCDLDGGFSEFPVPVRDDAGAGHMVLVRGQRVLETSGGILRLPLIDHGNVHVQSYARHNVRLWLPWQANLALPPGRYRTATAVPLTGVLAAGGGPSEPVAVRIEIDVHAYAQLPVDLSAGQTFSSKPYRPHNSSAYFLTRPDYGPNERVWLMAETRSELRVPVVDPSGTPHTLFVGVWADACGKGMRDMQAGEASKNCAHRLQLRVDPARNPHLRAGTTYRSPAWEPLPIFARRWHAPDAEALLEAFALLVTYTP